MKLRQIFEELTTKPNEFEIIISDKNMVVYEFDFKDREGKTREMTVDFNKSTQIKSKTYNEVDIFEVDFHEKYEEYETTNYGNADKVFATVIAIIKLFLGTKETDGIYFSPPGGDKKRMRVYKRLVPQFITNDYTTIEKDKLFFVVKQEKAEKLKNVLEDISGHFL